jgi:hypothetical protein
MYIMHMHAIKVRFVPPTNHKGSRVSFTSLLFGDRRIVSLPQELTMNRFMVQWLSDQGYAALVTAETPEGYLVLTTTFLPLSEKERKAQEARLAAL